MSDRRHVLGAQAEAIALELLTKHGFYCFLPFRGNGPIDIYAVHPDYGELRLDIKTDRLRVSPGRKVPARIHRQRTDIQKRLNVFMGYVDVDQRRLHVAFGTGTPPLRLE